MHNKVNHTKINETVKPNQESEICIDETINMNIEELQMVNNLAERKSEILKR